MADKHFVIIDTAGRAENLGASYKDWHSILTYVYAQVCSAGGSSPLADMLIVDGVFVEKNLSDIAFKYGRGRQRAIDRAVAEFVKDYPQPWEDKKK